MTRAYHFVGDTLRDGRPVPPDGEWLTHDGPCVMCESGLHASEHPYDALQYAPGAILCLVEIEDEVARQDDKLLCRRRKIIARIDATQLLRRFARLCALDVIHLWDAPKIVLEYLETGDESKRAAAWAAAGDAAGDAAGAAAGDAAGAAAWAAAWDAAWAAARAVARAVAGAVARAAQKKRFAEMVNAEFAAMGIEP